MIRQETITVIDIDADNKFFEYMGMSIVHYLQMVLPDLEEVEIRKLIEVGAVRISDVLIDDHEMRIFHTSGHE